MPILKCGFGKVHSNVERGTDYRLLALSSMKMVSQPCRLSASDKFPSAKVHFEDAGGPKD